MFQVIEACAYPIFVVFVAILGVLFLLGFGKNSLFLSMFSGNFYDSLIRSYSFGFVFLVLFFSISFLVLKNILGDNKMFESFLAADFLVRSGINFVDAMDALISVAGIDSKLGVIFQNAKIRMMDGLDLTVAPQHHHLHHRLVGQKGRHRPYLPLCRNARCAVLHSHSA